MMRFLKVIDGFPAPGPGPDPAPAPNAVRLIALLLVKSVGPADCFTGEPPETSKGPELELFCLTAEGHISSRGPGVSGV